MLPDEIDVQLYLSRNDRPQPFYLVCEKDTLVAQLDGEGQIEFKGSSVNAFPLAPGDYIYVPAGTPHRLIPTSESVVLRYKPRNPGLEAVAWYCGGCGTEIHRDTWDTAKAISHEKYEEACHAFNDASERRTCADCGAVHDTLDLSPYRWEQIAADIRQEAARNA
jgi:3-hydroxyanthranilate 3,4-dioxygenase